MHMVFKNICELYFRACGVYLAFSVQPCFFYKNMTCKFYSLRKRKKKITVRIIETTNPNSSSDSEDEDTSNPPPPPPIGNPKLYHTSDYIAKFSSSSKSYPSVAT